MAPATIPVLFLNKLFNSLMNNINGNISHFIVNYCNVSTKLQLILCRMLFDIGCVSKQQKTKNKKNILFLSLLQFISSFWFEYISNDRTCLFMFGSIQLPCIGFIGGVLQLLGNIFWVGLLQAFA